MVKKSYKNSVYILACVFSFLFIVLGNKYVNSRNLSAGEIYERENELDEQVSAKIISIDNVEDLEENKKEIFFTAKILGDKSGETIKGKQIIGEETTDKNPVALGDKVVMLSFGTEGYLFQHHYRIDKIIILGIVIAIIILFMGGKKGFNTILSLIFTCLSIFLVYIPAIRAGFNIYFSTIIIALFIIVMMLLIVYGITKKSVITAISCASGVIMAGSLSVFTDRWMKLTGFFNEDMFLLKSLFGFNINARAMVFAMITIGALGAIMDVSMSITSPLCEMKENDNQISSATLIKSGFNIGKDFMGTMSNTLILAYIGSALAVVLIYSASSYPLASILNNEEIIIEFLQSLIGCLGILFTIPLTTLISTSILNGTNIFKKTK